MKRKPEIELIKDFFASDDFLLKERGYGEKRGKQLLLSLYEGCFLIEKNRVTTETTYEECIKKGMRKDKDFLKKYLVYKNLKEKGYYIKTGLKYGADFRVYVKKGDHSKWILTVVSERDKFKWQEFAAKNRVAHSTRKKKLIAIVDDEGEISYYETDWLSL